MSERLTCEINPAHSGAIYAVKVTAREVGRSHGERQILTKTAGRFCERCLRRLKSTEISFKAPAVYVEGRFSGAARRG